MEGTNPKMVSRRQLIKALAATGGVVAASALVPGKWSKPTVGVGVLPAHAQVTPVPPVPQIIQCSGLASGSGPGLVPQGRRICCIIARTLNVPEGTCIRATVVANPPPAGGGVWVKERPTGCPDEEDSAGMICEPNVCEPDVAYFPCFRVPRDAPIGVTITFTFTFCDQGTFGNDSCSFVFVVEQRQGGDDANTCTTWGWDD